MLKISFLWYTLFTFEVREVYIYIIYLSYASSFNFFIIIKVYLNNNKKKLSSRANNVIKLRVFHTKKLLEMAKMAQIYNLCLEPKELILPIFWCGMRDFLRPNKILRLRSAWHRSWRRMNWWLLGLSWVGFLPWMYPGADLQSVPLSGYRGL